MTGLACETWSPSQHWDLVSSWVRARGIGADLGDPECYPSTGLIVGGCVAGWVFLTNCSLAWVGSFVADPDAQTQHRREAIAQLIPQLTELAKRMGARAVVSFPGPLPLKDAFFEAGFDIDTRSHAYARKGVGPCR